jgi:hypothetical protein
LANVHSCKTVRTVLWYPNKTFVIVIVRQTIVDMTVP